MDVEVTCGAGENTHMHTIRFREDTNVQVTKSICKGPKDKRFVGC